MTHCKRLFLLTWLIIFWTNFSHASADNTPPPTNNKNDYSIPLYIRYGYTDSITFIRDQLALSAYPYERVVAINMVAIRKLAGIVRVLSSIYMACLTLRCLAPLTRWPCWVYRLISTSYYQAICFFLVLPKALRMWPWYMPIPLIVPKK